MRIRPVFCPANATTILKGVVALAIATSGCINENAPSAASDTGGRASGGTSWAAGNLGGNKGGASGGSNIGSTSQSGGAAGKTGTGGATSGTAGSGGGAGGTAGTTPVDANISLDLASPVDLAAEVALPVGPYGCTGCKRIFDGKTLDGWVTVSGAWEIKDEALTSTGKASSIWTKDDYRTYRLFFQVRQLRPDHDPCVVLFGKRPTGPQGRDLGGAQFQPPNGSNWDYGAGGQFVQTAPNPPLDKSKWNQCEVLVRQASSETVSDASFRVACCTVGPTPCKTKEVLRWSRGKGTNHPICFMMHNPNILDQYKDIWIEENPTVTEYLSMK